MVKVPNRQLNVDSQFEFNSNIANAVLALTLISAAGDSHTTYEVDPEGYVRYSQVRLGAAQEVNRLVPMGRVFLGGTSGTESKPLVPQHYDMYVTDIVTQIFDKHANNGVGSWITLVGGSGGGSGTGDMLKSEFAQNIAGVVDEAALLRDRDAGGSLVEDDPQGFYIYGKISDGVGGNTYGFIDAENASTGLLTLSEFQTNYDSNGDGIVNRADFADEIVGNPAARQYYGTPDNDNTTKGFYDLPNYTGANQLTHNPVGGAASLYVDTNQLTRTHNFRGLVKGDNIQFGEDGQGNLVLSATSGGGPNLAFLGTMDGTTGIVTPAAGAGQLGDSGVRDGVPATQNEYYIVNVAGSYLIDGESSWGVGDWIVHNGFNWIKIDNSNSVTSVNGQTGVVNLTIGDINDGFNLGTHSAPTTAQVFAGKNVDNLEFNILEAGDGIAFDLTTTPGHIIIDSTVTPISYSSSFIGDGDTAGVGGLPGDAASAAIYYDTSGTDFRFRSLKAGTGVSFDLTEFGNIIINASGTGTGTINSGENIGGEVPVYSGVSLDKLQFRSFLGLDNVTIIQNADVVEVRGPTTTDNQVQYGDGLGGFIGEAEFIYDSANNRLSVEKMGAVTPGTPDTAGTNTEISGGASTGTGTGGKIVHNVTRGGAAGSTENTRVNVMDIDTDGVLNHTNPTVVSTNFIKAATYEDAQGETVTVWFGDNTTSPHTVLPGENGDICFNGDAGKIYRNISSPTGTDWQELGTGGAATLPETKTVRTIIDTDDAVAPLTDQVLQCQPNTVDMQIELPDATVYPGACWTISRDIADVSFDLDVVTASGSGQTINGAAFYPLNEPWESRTFLSRGAAGWRII
jgi:hypothetical protein